MKRSRLLSKQGIISHQIIPYSQNKNQPQKIQQILHQAWYNLVDYFTRLPEPKVVKTSNHRGETLWKVYDPYTNASAEFASEAEVRMWLDQRHYQ